MLLGPCVYCNTVLHVMSLHCSFMFTFLLSSACSSEFLQYRQFHIQHHDGTWYIHDSFLLLLWLGLLSSYEDFPQGSLQFPYFYFYIFYIIQSIAGSTKANYQRDIALYNYNKRPKCLEYNSVNAYKLALSREKPIGAECITIIKLLIFYIHYI